MENIISNSWCIYQQTLEIEFFIKLFNNIAPNLKMILPLEITISSTFFTSKLSIPGVCVYLYKPCHDLPFIKELIEFSEKQIAANLKPPRNYTN